MAINHQQPCTFIGSKAISIYKYYTIYQITNLLNDKQYIGCHRTNSFKSKKTQDYNQKYSSNKELDTDLKKYGKENFLREWLFIFDNEKDMLNKEYELVNGEWYKSEMTYNKTRGGGNPPKGSRKGKECSKKHKQKLSKVHIGNGNPMYGVKRTKKWCENHSQKMKYENNPSSKLTKNEVMEIRKLYQTKKFTQKDLAILFGVSRGCIMYIVTYRSWNF